MHPYRTRTHLSSHSSYGEAMHAVDRLAAHGMPRDRLYIGAFDLRPVRSDRSGPAEDAAPWSVLGAVTGGLVAFAFALYVWTDATLPNDARLSIAMFVAGVLLGGAAGLLLALVSGQRPDHADKANLSFRATRYEVVVVDARIEREMRRPNSHRPADVIDLRDLERQDVR